MEKTDDVKKERSLSTDYIIKPTQKFSLSQKNQKCSEIIQKSNGSFGHYDTNRFVNNFVNCVAIGEGGFGSVFKAKHKFDKVDYAIKVIKIHLTDNESLNDNFAINEVRTMINLDHENVVRYYTCWYEEQEESFFRNRILAEDDSITGTLFFIQMEYCDGLSLKELLEQPKRIEPKIVYHIFKQMLIGLENIHINGIIHRDLK